jgi:hypothetical protein
MTKIDKNSKCSKRQNWMTVSKHWCELESDTNTNKYEDLDLMFANYGEEDGIQPLATIEIAKAQKKDQ